MKKNLSAALALASGLSLFGSVNAATTSTTLDVTAIVGLACSVSTTPILFNATNPFVDTFANGGVTVTCNPGTPYDIALDGGSHFTGLRNVANGTNLLAYELFSTSDYLQVWGDGLLVPAPPVPGTGSGSPQQYTVYGQIKSGWSVPDGVYTDVVGVTVSY